MPRAHRCAEVRAQRGEKRGRAERPKPNDVVIARCPGGPYQRMFVKELSGDDVTVWKDEQECSVKRAELVFTDKN